MTTANDKSANYSVNSSVNNGNRIDAEDANVQLLTYTPNNNKSTVSKRNGTAHSGEGLLLYRAGLFSVCKVTIIFCVWSYNVW